AIQELILMEENDKSHTYLARFAKLLRMLLENANSPFIPLARELEFLELYLSLENLRIPDLKYSIRKDPEINTEQVMIPNMILQPYIENAIWHGLSHKKIGERELQLRVHKQTDGVVYEIEDNGVGRKKAAELKSLYRKEHRSKGMELLTKRFRLLNEEYRFDIRTSISDVIHDNHVVGTLVTIQAPHELSAEYKQSAA
ncbi:MAG TPA: histidine kinase, partial [Saprospiraceae bacterium]|nr:histidine kinase [Saprospiraceae bacterium]